MERPSTIITAADAAERLGKGLVVALPTETVYGLAALVSSADAVHAIYRLKGRPADNPLIVHVTDIDQADTVAVVTPEARRLAAAFWPGPLTLVLERRTGVAEAVAAGLPTVAVRAPDHAIFQDILRTVGEPLAAPSANLSGAPSPTTAEHVLQDHQGAVPVVDGGPCRSGLESTVVRVEPDRLILLRPGAIDRAALETASGLPVVDGSSDAKAASPGTRYRHYAPRARVRLFTDLNALLQAAETASGRVVVLSTVDPGPGLEWRPLLPQTLYAELRAADDLRVDEILVHCDSDTVGNEALMDRLTRAAASDPGKHERT